ncbi:PD-(D/E)XK nuclease family protein [candidate division WOR-3 bacterium]|nr:PD-(D/E)XK nuclease family protein [candidate division WOR-3 bacterium]
MNNFLYALYDRLGETDNKETLIILPSKRSIFYLKEIFKEKTSIGIIPEMKTMKDFVIDLSEKNPSDELTLSFILHDIFRNITKSNIGIETFLSFASIIIKDFNDIDKAMVNLDELNIVSEISEIEKNEYEIKDSTFRNDYYAFMEHFKNIYLAFVKKLIESNLAYEGLCYRLAANKDSNLTDYKKFVFAGLNALTHSEEQIIDKLMVQEKAEFYYELPEIFNDHESAYFINKVKGRWKKHFINLGIFEKEKQIGIIEMPLISQQAEALPEILNNIDEKEHIAIILNDETILNSVIAHIPKRFKNINITMGYPLKLTSVFAFIKLLIETCINSEKTDGNIYYKDIEKLISNPLIKTIKDNKTEIIINYIKKNLLIDINKNDINEFDNSILNAIFEFNETSNDLESILTGIENILNIIDDENNEYRTDSTEHISIFYIKMLLNNIQNALKYFINEQSVRPLMLFKQIFDKYAGTVTIPFSGDPLQNLQIMGMLETRGLSFDRVILMSVNEGIIPEGKSYNSFLPYDVREHWGLYTYKHEDMIYSYYFYRLLMNAKHITITYALSDNENYSEESRFIKQLLFENTKNGLFEKANIEYMSAKIDAKTKEKITKIKKTECIIDKLKNKVYSASSINLYMCCQIDFFFNYVLKAREHSAIDDIGYDKLGSISHEVLKKIYIPYIGSTIQSVPDEKEIKEIIKKTMKSEFSLETDKGKPYLYKEAIVKAIKNLIDNDIKREKGNIIALEKEFRGSINLNGNKILLNGIIDRVEWQDDNILIIDYKSGKIGSTELNIYDDKLINLEKWKENENVDYSKLFQMLFYAYLLKQDERYKSNDILMAIYTLRDSRHLRYVIKDKKPFVFDNNVYNEFEDILKEILSDIIEPTKCFDRSLSSGKFCKW